MAFDNLKKPELVAALGEFYAMNVDLAAKVAKLEAHLEKQAETICDLYEEKVELLKRIERRDDAALEKMLDQRKCRHCMWGTPVGKGSHECRNPANITCYYDADGYDHCDHIEYPPNWGCTLWESV